MIGSILRVATLALDPVRFATRTLMFEVRPRFLRAYLTRWHLVSRPTIPDGTAPFDHMGMPREGIRWSQRRWGLYLHRIRMVDQDRDLHNHPWLFGVSWVLSGGYVEEKLRAGVLRRRRVWPGMLNVIRHRDFHRISELPRGEAWTLILVGPKRSSWGFLRRETGEFVPWREYKRKAA